MLDIKITGTAVGCLALSMVFGLAELDEFIRTG
jgi:hypothetical protein